MRVTTQLEALRQELELRYNQGEKHYFRIRCLTVLLKVDGMSPRKSARGQNWKAYRCQMVQQVQEGGYQGPEDTSRQGPQADNGLLGQGGRQAGDRTEPAGVNRAREAWQLASGKEASDSTFKRILTTLTIK